MLPPRRSVQTVFRAIRRDTLTLIVAALPANRSLIVAANRSGEMKLLVSGMVAASDKRHVHGYNKFEVSAVCCAWWKPALTRGAGAQSGSTAAHRPFQLPRACFRWV